MTTLLSRVRFLRYEHECAYLLAKGDVQMPEDAPSDVIDWVYTGNRLHPTQKSAAMLKPLIAAFCPAGGLVLDPFCGSGSTLLERYHHRTASMRISAFATAA